MTISRRCKFYRDSEDTGMGRGLGYCDFDSYQTICDRDTQFREKPDALKKYLLNQTNREKLFEKGRAVFNESHVNREVVKVKGYTKEFLNLALTSWKKSFSPIT